MSFRASNCMEVLQRAWITRRIDHKEWTKMTRPRKYETFAASRIFANIEKSGASGMRWLKEARLVFFNSSDYLCNRGEGWLDFSYWYRYSYYCYYSVRAEGVSVIIVIIRGYVDSGRSFRMNFQRSDELRYLYFCFTVFVVYFFGSFEKFFPPDSLEVTGYEFVDVFFAFLIRYFGFVIPHESPLLACPVRDVFFAEVKVKTKKWRQTLIAGIVFACKVEETKLFGHPLGKAIEQKSGGKKRGEKEAREEHERN